GDLLALLALRLLHLDDQLGFLPGIADARAGLLVGGIRGADAAAGVRLRHHLVAVRHQLAHRGRRQADAVFVGLDLFRDADDHRWRAFARASTTEVCSPSSSLAIWLRCTSSGPSAKR